MGFNMNKAIESKWLTKDDVTVQGSDWTITRVTAEEVGQDKEERFVLHFQGGNKPMVLNKTNTRILISMLGQDSDQWIGQTVNVYNDPAISFAGQVTGGCRVRAATAPMARPGAGTAKPKTNADLANEEASEMAYRARKGG